MEEARGRCRTRHRVLDLSNYVTPQQNCVKNRARLRQAGPEYLASSGRVQGARSLVGVTAGSRGFPTVHRISSDDTE